MELTHSFTVPVGIDNAWDVLTDIERIAPCMPGAVLDEVDRDRFTGTVKVKLGPIALTYKGTASWVQRDETAHRAVLDAQGRDARGNGTAAATITAGLVPDGTSTRVDVVTELKITGKPAQFGRGVLADVGEKLIGQFADCLADKLSAGQSQDAVGEPGPVGAAEAVNVLGTAGPAVAKRAVPMLAVAVLVGLLLARRRRNG